MHPDGVGWIWVPSGLKDGPLPTHYEPLESPVENALYPRQQCNPAADRKERPGNAYGSAVDDGRFPHVLTTYRLTEHPASERAVTYASSKNGWRSISCAASAPA